MPFAIWCATCPKPTIIGQGVRFNADKARDGSYYSTPIWRFRMRHPACGGDIVIRTDPKNTAYEVVSGATKRDYGPEAGGDDDDSQQGKGGSGAGAILTDAERAELRKNAFAKLERTIDDREALKQAGERIDGLLEASSRDWDDPYTRNQRLRRTFRAGRKQREAEAVVTEALQDRMGLGIDLLPASEDDARRAAVVDFLPEDEGGEGRALAKPLFTTAEPALKGKKHPKGTTKAEKAAAARKEGFVSQVVGNTRAVRDPFINGIKDTKGSARLPGVKRKRSEHQESPEEQVPPSKAHQTTTGALVSYESDSD